MHVERRWVQFVVSRCVSISLGLFARVCIAGLGAQPMLVRGGEQGLTQAHMSVPACAWGAVRNTAEKNRGVA